MSDTVPTVRSAAPSIALLDCVDDAIVVIGPQLDVRYANRSAAALAAERDGTSVDGFGAHLIHPDDVELALDAVNPRLASATRRSAFGYGCRPASARSRCRSRTISRPTASTASSRVRNLEHEEALRQSIERQAQLDLHVQAALTDELTGLPNRRLFLERLERSLTLSDDHLAVFFVDLDDFKAINDALGHTAGDAMLRSTTSRLLNVCPQPDQWGRIGGDEFVLFLEHCDRERAARTAQLLCDSLRQPIVLGGRPCYTSASVGVSVVESGTVLSAAEAVRRADIAMYEGKRVKHGLVTPFRPEMEQR